MSEKIIYLKIPFKKMEKTHKDGKKTVSVSFTMEDFSATFIDGKKKIGKIAARMGGGLQITFTEDSGKDIYTTSYAIWNAYCDSIGKEKLKIKGATDEHTFNRT